MDKIACRPTTFRERKSYWKNDSVVRNLNGARNALYRAGFDELGSMVTREMHSRFDFLERYATEPTAERGK